MDNNQNNASNAMNNTENPQGNTWQLIGLSPALADLTIDIDKSLSIGRSDSNDLVLATSQISRQHAKINRIGEQLYVQDLGSSNGTFVNGERITTEAHALQATDELAFADLLFLVVNDNIDSFNSETFLDTLQQTATVTSTTVNDNQVDQIKVAPQETPTAATPVIDVITIQDFVPKQQSTISDSDKDVALNQVNEIKMAADDQEVSIDTQAPQMAAIPTSVTTNTNIAAEKPANAQPTVTSIEQAPIQQASIQQAPSPVTTVTSEQIKPAAKKNASLAIIIVVIIALIILATLFMH